MKVILGATIIEGAAYTVCAQDGTDGITLEVRRRLLGECDEYFVTAVTFSTLELIRLIQVDDERLQAFVDSEHVLMAQERLEKEVDRG